MSLPAAMTAQLVQELAEQMHSHWDALIPIMTAKNVPSAEAETIVRAAVDLAWLRKWYSLPLDFEAHRLTRALFTAAL